MIRLTPQRRPRISNRVALIAALALALVSYAGYVSRQENPRGPEAIEQAAVTQTVKGVSGEASERKRKLSISLLLFGRG